jgi:hypothetical protein
MKKFIIIISLFAIFSLSLFAMFDDYEPSARARAMSGAATSISDDAFAIFYNPAGVKFAENKVGISHFRLFNNDFSTVSVLGATYKTPFGSVAAGFQQMSVDFLDRSLMTEQQFSLGHSFTLNKDIHSEISIGYSGNLYSISFMDLGSDTAIGVNAGVIAVLHQRTRLGFMLTNINKPQIGDFDIPQQLAVGLSYIPYQGVITAFDLKKNWSGQTELRTGVEVALHEMVCIRMGVRNNPASYSVGAGFRVWDILLDYGISTHAVLDLTHHISLGYRF